MMVPTARRALREHPSSPAPTPSSLAPSSCRQRKRGRHRGGRDSRRRGANSLRSAMATPTWGERFTSGLFGIFDHLKRLASFSNLCDLEEPIPTPSHVSPASPPPSEDDPQLQDTLENLRQRIEETPMEGRRTPLTADPDILGRELKIRLAGMTPVLEEKVLENGQVQVIEHFPPWRIVPLYKIVNRGDPKVQGHVKVNMPP